MNPEAHRYQNKIYLGFWTRKKMFTYIRHTHNPVSTCIHAPEREP